MAVNYEDITPEVLKAELLDALRGSVETREGSYANILVSASAFQRYKIYQMIPEILLMAFPDETAGEYIDLRARDFGITRISGTKATCTLVFTSSFTSRRPSVPAGTVAVTEDGLRFVTLEDAVFVDQTATAPAEAEDIGRMYNVEANSITRMAVNISGVTAVTNPEEAVGGTDDESDAALLARYLEHLQRPTTSGNKNHYIAWAKEVNGVTFAEVAPLWDGPGTVKVIVAGPDKTPVDPTIVEDVAEHIETQRPVGADVTVVSVAGVDIDVSAQVTLLDAASIEVVQAEFATALDEYLTAMSYGRANVVRYSKVLALLLSCDGVEDYTQLTINGGTANVSVSAEQFPQAGTVSVTEGG